MTRGLVLVAAGLSAALTLVSPRAEANGRFPAAGHLVASASDPPLLALETTFGIVVSRGGAEWDWICEGAVGYSGSQDATVAIMGDQRIITGFAGGLAESQNGGCDFAYADIRSTSVDVVDVARPVGDMTLALASVWLGLTDAGGADVRTTLLRTAAGSAFGVYGPPLDPALDLETLDIAPSDAQRVYLSGVRRFPAAPPSGVFLSSTDGGTRFVEHHLPLVAGETAPYIAAVDPKRADRVYVRTASLVGPNRLLVTDDGGVSFREVFTSAGPLLGFALSRDGETMYFGGPKDGLRRGSTRELTSARVGDLPVKCLTSVGDALYACGETSLSVSTDGGESFRSVLRFEDIRGPLSCGKTLAACAPQWSALRQRLAGSADAGPADSGVDAALPVVVPPASARACALSEPGAADEDPAPRGAVLALVPLLFAALRRRRSKPA